MGQGPGEEGEGPGVRGRGAGEEIGTMLCNGDWSLAPGPWPLAPTFTLRNPCPRRGPNTASAYSSICSGVSQYWS